MKTIERWLLKPFVQRIVYALLLLLCLYIAHSNGSFRGISSFTLSSVSSLGFVAVPVLLLGAQVVWNKKWLWMLLCASAICFTLWLATLSISQIIAGAGAPAKTVVWGCGVIGFLVMLVFVLAFVNWALLHMKPKK